MFCTHILWIVVMHDEWLHLIHLVPRQTKSGEPGLNLQLKRRQIKDRGLVFSIPSFKVVEDSFFRVWNANLWVRNQFEVFWFVLEMASSKCEWFKITFPWGRGGGSNERTVERKKNRNSRWRSKVIRVILRWMQRPQKKKFYLWHVSCVVLDTGGWEEGIWAQRVRKEKPNLTLAASYLASNQNPRGLHNFHPLVLTSYAASSAVRLCPWKPDTLSWECDAAYLAWKQPWRKRWGVIQMTT